MVRFDGTKESFLALPSHVKFDMVRDFWVSKGDREITSETVSDISKKILFFGKNLKAWKDSGVSGDQVSDYLSSKVALRRVADKCEDYLGSHLEGPISREDRFEIGHVLNFLNRDNDGSVAEARRNMPLGYGSNNGVIRMNLLEYLF